MQIVSTLGKMGSYYQDPIQYQLLAENDFVKMNDLIGREVKVEFINEKYCCECGNMFKALFRMGFCRDCFFSSPEVGESVIRPELSQAHLGIEDRNLAYERAYQLQPHVVYLANSGGLKVGVTREKHKVARWIDQGASAAIVFAETSNRHEAGLIEVALKEYTSDKTPWQRMLRNEDPKIDFLKEKQNMAAALNPDLAKFVSANDDIYELKYPVKIYPPKVRGVVLDKDREVKSKLQGIRGQYLIFEGGGVLNVRGHSGYRVKISF